MFDVVKWSWLNIHVIIRKERKEFTTQVSSTIMSKDSKSPPPTHVFSLSIGVKNIRNMSEPDYGTSLAWFTYDSRVEILVRLGVITSGLEFGIGPSVPEL